jgi:hypothetical protein
LPSFEDGLAHSPSGTRDDPRIIIVDAVPWRVYERSLVYDRRSTPTLVFECDSVIRRIRAFPERWQDLDDAALFRLSVGR